MADFEGQNFLLVTGKEITGGKGLFFDFGGITNYQGNGAGNIRIKSSSPPSYEEYVKAFELVKKHILYGNTYLLNLTFASEIEIDGKCQSLEKVFAAAKSKYKVWLPGKFVCFSPEPFIRIDENGIISTYPMKGTADATLPGSRKMLEENQKELAEHYTIVDLLRNDLALVADSVQVRRFRYFEKIKSVQGELWQTSSEITGRLKKEYAGRYGDVLSVMLPAGSISGAPKKKTVEIIKETEPVPRGFYTGVAGLYDGKVLDTAVLIRFIENRDGRFFYRSGGGIVADSDVHKEYEELIKKIYLPV